MIINQIYSIDSCDDVELNIKRGSKLEFRLTIKPLYKSKSFDT